MLDPGAIFADHFRLLTILGTGAMATVYKAEDLILQRVVALKLLDATLVDSVAMDRFKVEVKASTLLSHPNIAKVYVDGVHRRSCAGLMKCRYMLKDYAAVDAALELGKRWAKEADSERVCRQYCTLAAACKFCNKPRESLKLYRQALSSLEWQLRENSEVKRVLKMDIKNEIAKLERL